MSNLIANTFPARPRKGGRFEPEQLIGDWKFQPKYNGWRAFIDLEADEVFNRHGDLMSIGDCFQHAINSIRYTALALGVKYLDAEALERRFDTCRGALMLFDIPDSTDPFEERMELLSLVAPVHNINKMPACNTALTVPTYDLKTSVGAWSWMQHLNNVWEVPIYEGIVAKKAGSEYPVTWKPDQPFLHWVKYRFDQFDERRAAPQRDCHIEREMQPFLESQGLHGMDIMR